MGYVSNCSSLPDTAKVQIDYKRVCQSGASGRYVYVYTHGVGDDKLNIAEIEVYGTLHNDTRM